MPISLTRLNEFFYTTLIVLIIASYPISAGLSELLGLPVESSIMAIIFRLLVLLAAFCLAIIAITRQEVFFKTKTLLILIFLFFYSFRLIYDLDIRNIDGAYPKIKYYGVFFGQILFPVLVICISEVPKNFSNRVLNLLKYILFFSLILNLFVLFFAYGGSFEESGLRLSSQKLNPISLGSLAVSLILCIYAERKLLKNTHKKISLLSLMMFLIALYTLGISGSKGPLVALVMAIFFVEYVLSKSKLNLIKNLMIFIFFIAPAFFVIGSSLDLSIIERLLSVNSNSETSIISRISLIIEASLVFLENPIIGYSIILPSGGYPHNIYLESFSSMGLIGGLLLIFFLIASLYYAKKLILFDIRFIIFGCLFAQYAVMQAFSGSISQVSEFFILGTLLLVTFSALKKQKRLSYDY